MNVLLAYPPFAADRIDHDNLAVMPMGVYYIGATLLDAGYPVEILDCQSMELDAAGLEAMLREKRPRVLGLSVLHANRRGAMAIARAARKVDPEMVVVLGGIGATSLWEHFLTHFPEVDCVVLGEGERTFLELVRRVEAGGLEALADLPGLALRRDGKPARNGPAEPIADLDTLPNPARHFTYQHLALTRGCPGSCTFCGSPGFWGQKVRSHSADYFVEQLELLHAKGVDFFYVSDDTFTLRREVVIEICRKIIAKGLKISWAAISRVNLISEEILRWMRLAGCIQISFGVESGSEGIRRYLNKNIRPDQVRQAFALAARYGILARAYFIYGCPGESRETIRETVDLMKAIRPLMVNFYVLSIFPGTAICEEFKKRCGLTDDIWLKPVSDILYFETDPALSPEKVMEFRATLRREFYGNLPSFAEAVELVDDQDLRPFHADFLSRLGLTFDRGDYATVEEIPDKQGTAERLYRRALGYAPDGRAYLGLGMILQRRRDFEGAETILAEGLKHFANDPQLRLCLALTLMNRGRFAEALGHLQRHAGRPDYAPYVSACREHLSRRA